MCHRGGQGPQTRTPVNHTLGRRNKARSHVGISRARQINANQQRRSTHNETADLQARRRSIHTRRWTHSTCTTNHQGHPTTNQRKVQRNKEETTPLPTFGNTHNKRNCVHIHTTHRRGSMHSPTRMMHKATAGDTSCKTKYRTETKGGEESNHNHNHNNTN